VAYAHACLSRYAAGEAVLFCRVSEEGALGSGKWEAGTFVKRPSKGDLVVTPVRGAFLELTLPPRSLNRRRGSSGEASMTLTYTVRIVGHVYCD